MKTSFNSIGKAFKRLFSTPKKQTVTPAKEVHEKKVIDEPKEKIPKRSTSAYGIKIRNIYINRRNCKENKVRKRRKRNKMARRSRQVNYRIAA